MGELIAESSEPQVWSVTQKTSHLGLQSVYLGQEVSVHDSTGSEAPALVLMFGNFQKAPRRITPKWCLKKDQWLPMSQWS